MHTQAHPTANKGTHSAVSVTLTPPIPGQYWPEQNAWYAGIMRSEDGLTGWHLLLPDGPKFKTFKSAWGEEGQRITGADHRYDGYANTLAMAEADSPLAQKIRKLPGDCHLASRAECALLYATLHEQFEPYYHWTSTQYSDDSAWSQYFSYGLQYNNYKSYEARARAVRRLVLQSFNPSEGGVQ